MKESANSFGVFIKIQHDKCLEMDKLTHWPLGDAAVVSNE